MLTQIAALQAAKTVGGQVARGLAKPITGEGQLGDTITRMGTKSLIEYTQSTRVEPIVLLDTSCIHLPYIEDVLKVVNSLFAAYYLQAVAISVNVGRVDTVRLLDRLNPSRSVTNAAAALIGDVFSGESDSLQLPRLPDDVKASVESGNYGAEVIPSLESVSNWYKNQAQPAITTGRNYIDAQIDKQSKAAGQINRNITSGQYPTYTTDANGNTIPGNPINARADAAGRADAGSGPSARSVTDVSEITNLCIGKMLDVHIQSGKSSAVIPVQVRLIVSGIANNILVNIFKAAAKNLTFTERYHAWRSGQISFLKDFILCRDILKEHRDTLRGDKSGTYAAMAQRRTNNQNAGVLSRDPSVATMSNIAIFTSQTAQEIEFAIGGKLDDFKLREQIFERTMLMIMVVIDQRREQIKIYHHSIPLPTKLNLISLKAANKGTGPDILKIIETLTKGQNPVI